LSIQSDTIISEYRSAVLLKKNIEAGGGIIVHADSLYQQTTYCKLWEEFYCGSKIINFTTIRIPSLNIFWVPIYPRNF
jgi:hypothetical protein